MKQQTYLYVLGLVLLAAIGFASMSKSPIALSIRERVSSFQNGGSSSELSYTSRTSAEDSSSSYSPSSHSETQPSSSSGTSFFETAYSSVASFFGFENVRKKSAYNSSSGGLHVDDSSSGGGGRGGGGGGGGAGGGGGSGVEKGKSGAGGGGSLGSAPKSSNGDGDDEDDDDEEDPSQEPPGNQPLPDPIKTASEQAKESFGNQSHLSVPYPQELDYRPLDLDDDIAAINGYNTALGVNLSLLAKAGSYGPSDLQEFLAEYGSAIPGFNSSIIDNISENSAERPPAQSGSGLKSPYVWSVQYGNKTLTVALVQRQDGQGTYLAVLSGPTSYIDGNEDKYDAIYSQIKANP